MSKQVRLSWVGLLVNAGVGIAYFGFLFIQPQWQLMAFTVVPWIILIAAAIGSGVEIVLWLLFGRVSDPVRRDERDGTITLRARRNAYFALAAVVGYIIARILTTELYVHTSLARVAPRSALIQGVFLDPLTPTAVMLLLLFALTAASCVVHASRIAYYRFGLELNASPP